MAKRRVVKATPEQRRALQEARLAREDKELVPVNGCKLATLRGNLPFSELARLSGVSERRLQQIEGAIVNVKRGTLNKIIQALCLKPSRGNPLFDLSGGCPDHRDKKGGGMSSNRSMEKEESLDGHSRSQIADGESGGYDLTQEEIGYVETIVHGTLTTFPRERALALLKRIGAAGRTTAWLAGQREGSVILTVAVRRSAIHDILAAWEGNEFDGLDIEDMYELDAEDSPPRTHTFIFGIGILLLLMFGVLAYVVWSSLPRGEVAQIDTEKKNEEQQDANGQDKEKDAAGPKDVSNPKDVARPKIEEPGKGSSPKDLPSGPRITPFPSSKFIAKPVDGKLPEPGGARVGFPATAAAFDYDAKIRLKGVTGTGTTVTCWDDPVGKTVTLTANNFGKPASGLRLDEQLAGTARYISAAYYPLDGRGNFLDGIDLMKTGEFRNEAIGQRKERDFLVHIATGQYPLGGEWRIIYAYPE